MSDDLKLYKLLTDEDSPVCEFGWLSKNEFCVWIYFFALDNFMKEIQEIVGDYLGNDGGTDCTICGDTIVIDIYDALEANDIEVENVFPIDEFRH